MKVILGLMSGVGVCGRLFGGGVDGWDGLRCHWPTVDSSVDSMVEGWKSPTTIRYAVSGPVGR